MKISTILERIKKLILSKDNLKVFGIIYLYFGLGGIAKNIIMLIQGYPVFKVITIIKILTVVYYLLLIYIVLLGIALLRAKKWVSKSIMPIPFIFLFFVSFHENVKSIGLAYIIFWFLFFAISVLFVNNKKIQQMLH